MKQADKITALAAIHRETKTTAQNTRVEDGDVYLHEHKIFWWEGDTPCFSMRGWPTVTTRARINACLDQCGADNNRYGISQKDGEQIFLQRFPFRDDIVFWFHTPIDDIDEYRLSDLMQKPTHAQAVMAVSTKQRMINVQVE